MSVLRTSPRAGFLLVVLVVSSGCGSGIGAQPTLPSVESSASGGYETARLVLMDYFIALAGDDRESIERVLCSSGEDLSSLLADYRHWVDEQGSLRLKVASVDPVAAAGVVAFSVTTDSGSVDLSAILETQATGGICLARITDRDGVSGPSLPVWPSGAGLG